MVSSLDRSLTIIGTKGVLYVPDIRNDNSPVYFKKIPPLRIESALEYRINHFRLKFENLINFFPWNWGKIGFFIKKFHSLIDQILLVQEITSQLIFVMVLQN